MEQSIQTCQHKVPDQFDNSNWSKDFIVWLEALKFSTSCGDLALQGKIRMYKFIKSDLFEYITFLLSASKFLRLIQQCSR